MMQKALYLWLDEQDDDLVLDSQARVGADMSEEAQIRDQEQQEAGQAAAPEGAGRGPRRFPAIRSALAAVGNRDVSQAPADGLKAMPVEALRGGPAAWVGVDLVRTPAVAEAPDAAEPSDDGETSAVEAPTPLSRGLGLALHHTGHNGYGPHPVMPSAAEIPAVEAPAEAEAPEALGDIETPAVEASAQAEAIAPVVTRLKLPPVLIEQVEPAAAPAEVLVAPVADEHPSITYRRGLDHLQSGEWPQAIALFESLLAQHGDSASLESALAEARFKARLDQATRVRAKRWIVPWRRLSIQLGMVAVVALLVLAAMRIYDTQLAPALAEYQAQTENERRLRECNRLLESGRLEDAQACFVELQPLMPDNAEIAKHLGTIAKEQELAGLYQEARRLEDEGAAWAETDCEQAHSYCAQSLAVYTEILRVSPQYRDARVRVTGLQNSMALYALYATAVGHDQAGRAPEAVEAYRQIRAMNNRFRAEEINGRLYELYMRMGLEIIERATAGSELDEARQHFQEALKVWPSSKTAAREKQLVSQFLNAQTLYYQGAWSRAIEALRPIVDERPDYLGGTVAAMLYDAYIHRGDEYREAEDFGMAYEMCRKAADLPVEDVALALNCMDGLRLFLTPTATPTLTPTPTDTPLPTTAPSPTPVPTPRPLAQYRNQIVFYSENPDEPGLWVMDPSGGNRQFLGKTRALMDEYSALVERGRYSPDGRYYLFVQRAGKSPQIFVLLPKHEQYGDLPPQQLTRLTGMCYDPVWSPDGSRVAFVSQENGSDDVWMVQADGSNQRNLTANTWPWDKHPSWSPDSRQLVFWSNRDGPKQIMVMDAEGRGARNISHTTWDEYDPIWIK